MKGNVIAETRPNFFSNTSNITYSARAANNPYLLGKTMAHETAHAYVNKLTRFIPTSSNGIKSKLSEGRLDTIEHIAIKKLENTYYNINFRGMNMNNLNIIPESTIDGFIKTLSPTIQSQVESWTNRLYGIFARKVGYEGVSW